MIDWSKRKCWTAEQIREAGGVPESLTWGSAVEIEIRRRISLSVATYAYEIADKPIMWDHDWDRIAQLINPTVGTCHPLLDEFFATHFSPMTGMWIQHHPELDKIAALFKRYYSGVTAAHYDRVGHMLRPRLATEGTRHAPPA